MHTSDSHAATPTEGLEGPMIHLGIAEQGKVYALAGDHKLALLYLRHAMHLTVQAGDPELFFRVYLEAALESMERLGYFEEVLSYTDKAIDLYADQSLDHVVACKDLASIHQKRGVILLKQKKNKEAAPAFQKAIDLMAEKGQNMPLSETLLRWAKGGLFIDERRILQEQERQHYFSVRTENVDPKRAIKLPNENMLQIH